MTLILIITLAVAGAGLLLVFRHHYYKIIDLAKKLPDTIFPEVKDGAKITDEDKRKKKERKEKLINTVFITISWIILHIALWLAWPTLSEYILTQSTFWAFQVIFLIAVLFAGQFKISSILIRLMIWTVAIVLFMIVVIGKIRPDTHEYIKHKERTILALCNRDMVQKTKMTIKETSFKMNQRKIAELQEQAKDPNSPLNKDPNSPERKELEELEKSIALPLPLEPPSPPRRRQIIVETIDLPANKVVNTQLKREEGDRIEYENKSDYRGYFWVINKPQNIKVVSNRATREMEASDKLELKGGPKDLRITIKIIPGYYLNHR